MVHTAVRAGYADPWSMTPRQLHAISRMEIEREKQELVKLASGIGLAFASEKEREDMMREIDG